MADSYIYTLPEALQLSANDYTVVDTYVTAQGYVTKRATIDHVIQASSSTITQIVTSQLPINSWNSTTNTVSLSSSSWSSTHDSVQSLSSVWSSTSLSALSTDVSITNLSSGQALQFNGAKWVNTTTNTLTNISSISLDTAILSSTFATTPVSADEYIMCTINGTLRLINLWKLS